MSNHILKILVLLTSMFIFSVSFAQSKDEKKPESSGSDKLDIQKLEQKYWSAKDDDFTVIQNRAFAKEKRMYLSLNYGTPYNDPNSVGTLMGLNLGYYFSERWGVELNYNTANFRYNDTIEQYRAQYGTVPDNNTYKGATSVLGYWVPIYAKMSWLDKKIIYFDMGFGFGMGMTNFEQNRCAPGAVCTSGSFQSSTVTKSAMHYTLNIMQQFFISEHWAIRADFINRWTNEERLRFSNGDSQGTKSINDTALQIGVTYWK